MCLLYAVAPPPYVCPRAHKNGRLVYVKIATGQNFLPVLKIATRSAQAVENVNVAKCARDQFSIFSTVQ